MHDHETLRHGRRRRKRTRKLSDNRELMASVIVMVTCGVLLTAFLIWVISTRSCQAPKFLQRVDSSGTRATSKL